MAIAGKHPKFGKKPPGMTRKVWRSHKKKLRGTCNPFSKGSCKVPKPDKIKREITQRKRRHTGNGEGDTSAAELILEEISKASNVPKYF
jgi:hypothetical protein